MNKLTRITICFFLLSALSCFCAPGFAGKSTTPDFNSVSNQANYQPKAFAYWAGWSAVDVPDLPFTSLILAFGIVSKDWTGFKIDYSASGNFPTWSSNRSYSVWNNWAHKYFDAGARVYVSIGGGTNDNLRLNIVQASDSQLDQLATIIAYDVKRYWMNGVDLDIENWWSYDSNTNCAFAKKLTTLVKFLRGRLDADSQTAGAPIAMAVGYEAVGAVSGLPSNGAYAGTMLPFFQDQSALNAISYVYIMSYNVQVSNFYSRPDLVNAILQTFEQIIPKEKIVFGIQPYQRDGDGATPLSDVTAIGQIVKYRQDGGVFLWGIGTEGIKGLSSWDYMDAMMKGLGLR